MTHVNAMIGKTRATLLSHIKQAIESSDAQRTLYFYGSAGIGKTRLLEEVKNLKASITEKGGGFIWSGVIDIYHSNLQNRLGIEAALVRALDPYHQFFVEYNRLRDQLSKSQIAFGHN